MWETRVQHELAWNLLQEAMIKWSDIQFPLIWLESKYYQFDFCQVGCLTYLAGRDISKNHLKTFIIQIGFRSDSSLREETDGARLPFQTRWPSPQPWLTHLLTSTLTKHSDPHGCIHYNQTVLVEGKVDITFHLSCPENICVTAKGREVKCSIISEHRLLKSTKLWGFLIHFVWFQRLDRHLSALTHLSEL